MRLAIDFFTEIVVAKTTHFETISNYTLNRIFLVVLSKPKLTL